MIAMHNYTFEGYETIARAAIPVLKQAAIWGGSSALATKMTGDDKSKEETPEEKKARRKKLLKNVAISGALGAGAGALGALV